MNLRHIRTMLHLRWKLSVNAAAKAGKLNRILTIILLVALFAGSTLAFFVALFAGNRILGKTTPNSLMLVWDGLLAGFVVLVLISIVTEIQRSELITFEKLLHLPLSLREVFVLNYVSSWFSFAVIAIVPFMLGLSISLVKLHGPFAILNLITTFSFVAMMTALTYQLRGWLARLLANKRRRGTVVAITTFSVIVLAQLPNAANIYYQRQSRMNREAARQTAEQLESDHGPNEGEDALTQDRLSSMTANGMTTYVRIANTVIPFGWPAIAVRGIAMGNPFPAVLSSIGMLLIARVSLASAYRSTLRNCTSGDSPVTHAKSRPHKALKASKKRLPWIPNIPGLTAQVRTVATFCFLNFVRAPQAKMALFTPFVITLAFGYVFVASSSGDMQPNMVTTFLRPFASLGLLSTLILGMTQFFTNLFGLDRSGFRMLVLMPIQRRDVLLGRNLAMFPIVAVQALIMLIAIQILAPLSLSRFLATVLQVPIVFLLLSTVGNYVSIVAPYAYATGGTAPANAKLVPILLQLALMLFCPFFLMPACLALGVELLAGLGTSVWSSAPIYLVVSIIELGAVAWLYLRILNPQGQLLFEREPRILTEVTSLPE